MDEQEQPRTGLYTLEQVIDLEHLSDRRGQTTDWLMNVTRTMHRELMKRVGDGRDYRVLADLRLLVLVAPCQARVGELVDGRLLSEGVPEGCHFVEVEGRPGVWERVR
jgi:hypothetical protein